MHFVASDAHETAHRPPTLGDAYAALAADWGEDVVRPLFVDNPRAVLTGEPLEIVSRPQARRRQWYRLWS